MTDGLPVWLAVLVAPFVGTLLAALIDRRFDNRPADQSHMRDGDGRGPPRSGGPFVPGWYLPIAGWFRPRHDGQGRRFQIDGRRVAAELGAVIVAGWAATAMSGWVLLATCALGWTLLALAIVDLDQFMLPDLLTLPLLAAGLAVSLVVDSDHVLAHVIGAVAGLLLVMTVRSLYAALRGREGIGLGDAKLLAAIGAWVTWQGLPSVLLAAAGAGLLAVLVGSVTGKGLSAARKVPFGPFLAGAGWLVWLYGPLTFA